MLQSLRQIDAFLTDGRSVRHQRWTGRNLTLCGAFKKKVAVVRKTAAYTHSSHCISGKTILRSLWLHEFNLHLSSFKAYCWALQPNKTSKTSGNKVKPHRFFLDNFLAPNFTEECHSFQSWDLVAEGFFLG